MAEQRSCTMTLLLANCYVCVANSCGLQQLYFGNPAADTLAWIDVRQLIQQCAACLSAVLQLSLAHRTPYRPIQMTVPETPSPEVLMQQQAVVGTSRRGGPGRNVSDTTPGKGRIAKAQRVDDGGMGGGRE